MKSIYGRLLDYDPLWENWKLSPEFTFGHGAQGTVFRYTRDLFGHREESAVKVLEVYLYPNDYDNKAKIEELKKIASNDVLIMDRFRNEPNIMQIRNYAIKDIIENDKVVGFDVFLQMDVMEPIYRAFDDEDLSIQDIEKLAIQIGTALNKLHKNDVMHRDVKIDNILVNEKGDFVLTDFGVARENLEGTTFSTRVGTGAYEAPEIRNCIAEKAVYRKNADIYSFGIVLYYMLNHRLFPFQSEDSSQEEKQEAIAHRYEGAKLPEPQMGSTRLKRIVMKCCEFDPEQRYQHMEEVLRELYDCLGINTLVLLGKVDYIDLTQYTDGSPSDTIYYESGDIYVGRTKDHKPHGQGKKEYHNGDVFEGLWGDGIAQDGTYTSVNGTVFEGKMGVATDGLTAVPLSGTILYSGEMLQKEDGEFANNPNGPKKYYLRKGKRVLTSGIEYEGDFLENGRFKGKKYINDILDYEGELIFADSSVDEEKNGFGCQYDENGQKEWEGFWLHGKRAYYLTRFVDHVDSDISVFFYDANVFDSESQRKITQRLSTYYETILSETISNHNMFFGAPYNQPIIDSIKKSVRMDLVNDYIFRKGKMIMPDEYGTESLTGLYSGNRNRNDIPCAFTQMRYGPERELFSREKLADHITFNSLADNPVIGDERFFVKIGKAGDKEILGTEMNIVAGEEYEVRIYYNNNADPETNKTGAGMARNVFITTGYPCVMDCSRDEYVFGAISCSNARQASVWNSCILRTSSKKRIYLNYVPGSGRIHNNGKLNNAVTPSSLLSSEGIALGFNKFSGMLPGGMEYSGYISYIIRAVSADCSVEMSLSGESDAAGRYSQEIEAVSGGIVHGKIRFVNSGSENLRSVCLRIGLPEGAALVNGTTVLTNNANPNGLLMKDILHKNGFNTGLYGPGATAEIKFDIKILNIDSSKKVYAYLDCLTDTEKSGISKSSYATVKKKPEAPKEKVSHVTKTYPSGDTYTGEMINGVRNGYGEYYFSDGRVYMGNWKNGVYEGYGQFYYTNGDCYKGNWHNGKKEGDGELIQNESALEGFIFDNYDYELHTIYKGNRKNNNMDGRIVKMYAGVPYDEDYQDGKAVETKLYYDIPFSNDPKSKGISAIYGGQSSFVLELDSATLVFDWYRSSIPVLNPSKPIYVFISHVHLDHFNKGIFGLAERYPNTHFYIGFREGESAYHRELFNNLPRKIRDAIEFYGGYKEQKTEWGKVTSLVSTDLGVAFLVEIEGKVLYHAGDLMLMPPSMLSIAKTRRDKIIDVPETVSDKDYLTIYEHFIGSIRTPGGETILSEFAKYTDKLRKAKIDYAMLPLDPRFGMWGFRTLEHYLDTFNIRLFTPMHLWEKYEFASEYAKAHPAHAAKMIAVNPQNASIAKSIELNKQFSIDIE